MRNLMIMLLISVMAGFSACNRASQESQDQSGEQQAQKEATDAQASAEEGKWNDFSDYGKAECGYIGLQDHGHKAWFRNIKIKEL